MVLTIKYFSNLPVFYFLIKLAHYTPVGFDLTTLSSSTSVVGGDETLDHAAKAEFYFFVVSIKF
jgi:hypothetical protein